MNQGILENNINLSGSPNDYVYCNFDGDDYCCPGCSRTQNNSTSEKKDTSQIPTSRPLVSVTTQEYADKMFDIGQKYGGFIEDFVKKIRGKK